MKQKLISEFPLEKEWEPTELPLSTVPQDRPEEWSRSMENLCEELYVAGGKAYHMQLQPNKVAAYGDAESLLIDLLNDPDKPELQEVLEVYIRGLKRTINEIEWQEELFIAHCPKETIVPSLVGMVNGERLFTVNGPDKQDYEAVSHTYEVLMRSKDKVERILSRCEDCLFTYSEYIPSEYTQEVEDETEEHEESLSEVDVYGGLTITKGIEDLFAQILDTGSIGGYKGHYLGDLRISVKDGTLMDPKRFTLEVPHPKKDVLNKVLNCAKWDSDPRWAYKAYKQTDWENYPKAQKVCYRLFTNIYGETINPWMVEEAIFMIENEYILKEIAEENKPWKQVLLTFPKIKRLYNKLVALKGDKYPFGERFVLPSGEEIVRPNKAGKVWVDLYQMEESLGKDFYIAIKRFGRIYNELKKAHSN